MIPSLQRGKRRPREGPRPRRWEEEDQGSSWVPLHSLEPLTPGSFFTRAASTPPGLQGSTEGSPRSAASNGIGTASALRGLISGNAEAKPVQLHGKGRAKEKAEALTRVAQLARHCPVKRKVTGSFPSQGSKKKKFF